MIARSQLRVSRSGPGSSVTGARSETPLRLLTPKNHGHAAWVFQSSHGGGFVGADQVELSVEVEPGAALFLSSQASSKVYRAARSRFTLEARVGPGATLVSWPDPVACFQGASLTQRQRFALDPGASLLLVDGWTAGRASNGERWAFAQLDASLEVEVEGVRCLQDGWLLSGEHGDLEARMGPLDAFATVVLAGPRLDAARAAVEEAGRVPLRPLAEAALLTCARWEWGTVARLGAPSAEALAVALRGLLREHVAALLGDDPCARKW